jgi:hypothetical protein
MFQFVLTPAAGKRLIAKAVAALREVRAALESGTVVVVAGTTNGYVAEELLAAQGGAESFDRKRFFRGVTLPPSQPAVGKGSPSGAGAFQGDVIFVHGFWQKGKTIFDVVDDLKEGDVILKGANALDLSRRQAGVLIGDPKGGTIAVALQAAIGRRVRLIVPVGVEKRIAGDLLSVAQAECARGKRPQAFPGSGRSADRAGID